MQVIHSGFIFFALPSKKQKRETTTEQNSHGSDNDADEEDCTSDEGHSIVSDIYYDSDSDKVTLWCGLMMVVLIVMAIRVPPYNVLMMLINMMIMMMIIFIMMIKVIMLMEIKPTR